MAQEITLYGIHTLVPTTDNDFVLVYDTNAKPDSNNEVWIRVDTSQQVVPAAVNVVLPQISLLKGIWNLVISVTDVTGNAAAFPINILPSGADKINGTSILSITVNYGNLTFNVVDYYGWGAAGNVGGVTPSLQDVLNFNHDLVNGNNFQGTNAGQGNTGTNALGLGQNAAQNNGADYVIAIGSYAATNNNANNLVAIGNQAFTNGNGSFNIAIGKRAGRYNTGNDLIALGFYSCQFNTASDTIGIGANALLSNSGVHAIGIGRGANDGNSGDHSVAIGNYTLVGNDAGYAIAIGRRAGQNNAATGSNLIAIGNRAGQYQTGGKSIALGYQALASNSGNDVIAFGDLAGKNNSQSGRLIFSNLSVPQFANRAAALAAITVPLGASPNCTYFYFNQGTGAIEAVRT